MYSTTLTYKHKTMAIQAIRCIFLYIRCLDQKLEDDASDTVAHICILVDKAFHDAHT